MPKEKKPAVQAAGADPSHRKFINRPDPPNLNIFRNFWTHNAILISIDFLNDQNLCNLIILMTEGTIQKMLGFTTP